MVAPLCPPTTVTGESFGEAPTMPAKKRAARTTSRVVIPNTCFGSKTPSFSSVAATMGTVELTGLEITRIWASGATRPTAEARSRTMEALVW
jgi:hypothetical protein